MAAVDAGCGEQEQPYKFRKMLSKREAKGSSDGAREGDAGEGVAAKETEIGLPDSWASLLVLEGLVSFGGNILKEEWV